MDDVAAQGRCARLVVERHVYKLGSSGFLLVRMDYMPPWAMRRWGCGHGTGASMRAKNTSRSERRLKVSYGSFPSVEH